MRKIKTCDANEHAGFEVLSEAVGRPIKAHLSTHEAAHKILFSICTRKNLCRRTHLWPLAVKISTPN